MRMRPNGLKGRIECQKEINYLDTHGYALSNSDDLYVRHFSNKGYVSLNQTLR